MEAFRDVLKMHPAKFGERFVEKRKSVRHVSALSYLIAAFMSCTPMVCWNDV